MTREKNKNVTLQDRCKIANKKKANLFVSIHRNSAETGNGIEIWSNSEKREKDNKLFDENLKEYAKAISEGIIEYVGKEKLNN